MSLLKGLERGGQVQTVAEVVQQHDANSSVEPGWRYDPRLELAVGALDELDEFGPVADNAVRQHVDGLLRPNQMHASETRQGYKELAEGLSEAAEWRTEVLDENIADLERQLAEARRQRAEETAYFRQQLGVFRDFTASMTRMYERHGADIQKFITKRLAPFVNTTSELLVAAKDTSMQLAANIKRMDEINSELRALREVEPNLIEEDQRTEEELDEARDSYVIQQQIDAQMRAEYSAAGEARITELNATWQSKHDQEALDEAMVMTEAGILGSSPEQIPYSDEYIQAKEKYEAATAAYNEAHNAYQENLTRQTQLKSEDIRCKRKNRDELEPQLRQIRSEYSALFEDFQVAIHHESERLRAKEQRQRAQQDMLKKAATLTRQAILAGDVSTPIDGGDSAAEYSDDEDQDAESHQTPAYTESLPPEQPEAFEHTTGEPEMAALQIVDGGQPGVVVQRDPNAGIAIFEA